MFRLAKTNDQISVVSDQIGTPTNASDLADAILTILPKVENHNVEVFHFSNEGVCSWYDFAKTIFEISAINVKVKAIETSKYPTAAARPFYSVLNKVKFKNKFNFEIPHWRDSLKKYFNVGYNKK
jgi:dTDP-4-dehydrorhamnose reductase